MAVRCVEAMCIALACMLLLIHVHSFTTKAPLAALLNQRLSVLMSVPNGRNQFVDVNSNKICFDYFKSSTSSTSIVYLPGLIREKTDPKSLNLQSWCKKSDFTFFCADYLGVGRSSGKFQDGSVSRWADDTIHLLESVVGASPQQKVILVGHGVGAWISFVIAKKRADLVSGIIGMSADPDFTEELLWKKLSPEVKEKIMNDGLAEITWGTEKYLISRNLIEDGRKNLLLSGGSKSIKVKCPVRLIHGLSDEEVPFSLAMQLIDSIESPDASILLSKNSDHAMDTERDMRAVRSLIMDVLTAFKGDFDLRSPASG